MKQHELDKYSEPTAPNLDRTARILELLDGSQAGEDQDLLDQPPRYLAVEYSCIDGEDAAIFAMSADTLPALVDAIDSSESQRESVKVYDLDSDDVYTPEFRTFQLHKESGKGSGQDHIAIMPQANIDWKELRNQKAWLIAQDENAAEGLLSLLDAIQDHAVDAGVVSDEVVFGPKDADDYHLPVEPLGGESKDQTYSLDRAELATILAALRTYQAAGYGEPANRPDDIHDIATDGDVISLDAVAIDTLCERINR